jgi:AraC-like DNA-binding protein/quercetin dioxygenase-like cupin family protein
MSVMQGTPVERKPTQWEKGFPFEVIHTFGPANNMPRYHWHNFVEISYVRDGSGVYEVEDATFEVEKDDFVVIKRDERHRVRYKAPSRLFETVMHFDPSLVCSDRDDRFDVKYLELFLSTPNSGVNKVRIPDEEAAYYISLVRQIQTEFQTRPPLYDLMIKSNLLTLVTALLRYGGFDPSFDPEDTARHRNELKRLNRVTSYIRHHSQLHLTLPEVADHFAMNASYFSSWFHKQIGVTFSDFLSLVRVEKAVPLLRDGKLRVLDVIYECGFNTPASFYRAFRKATGSSPRAYAVANSAELPRLPSGE